MIQEVRRKLVEVAVKQHRWGDAADQLEILVKELPNDVDLINLLGKCRITLGRKTKPSPPFPRPSPRIPSG